MVATARNAWVELREEDTAFSSSAQRIDHCDENQQSKKCKINIKTEKLNNISVENDA